jgi:hypothetical protein
MSARLDDAASGRLASGRTALDAVVTHHRDGFRSGVARFNEILAARLGVPLVAIEEVAGSPLAYPLLSFKVRELSPASARSVEDLARSDDLHWELFLHDFADLPLERELVRRARRVHCGNHELETAVSPLNAATTTLWTPGLLLDDRRLPQTQLSVFSFGMAHKIRADMFRRLRTLLERTGMTYAIYVSAANHETATLRDAEAVFEEMHQIFPSELYFLGNLSDVAVANQLAAATFFAAFFQDGVRANNTSVASAMERGCVVVTNLDRWSPPELVHLDNVIDIEQCEELPLDPHVLDRLRARAVETRAERGWESLVEALR